MKNVFLIGAGRSGTKFTRSIIAAAARVYAVPYDVNYIWREGLEYWPDDALPVERLTPERAARIRCSLYRQAGVPKRVGENDIFIEKSVSNTLRVPYISAVYPDAKFIHLIRDGRDVVESSYRNWTSPPDIHYLWKKAATFPWRNWRYALWYSGNLLKGWFSNKRATQSTWGPRYPKIDDDLRKYHLLTVVARQWRICVDTANNDLAHLPEERVLEVRYENLVSDEGEIRRIAEFLNIEDVESMLTKFRTDLRPVASSRAWDTRFSNEEKHLVMEEIEGALRRLGYESG